MVDQSWQIRPSAAHDYAATRLLLPQAVHFGAQVHTWVAVDEQAHIVGAAAMSLAMRKTPVLGPRAAVHVTPPWRRRGVGRALVEAVAAGALQRGAQAIYAWDPVDAAGPERDVWTQLKFSDGVELQEGRNPIEPGFAKVEKLYNWLVQRQWIPAGASIVPLAEADPWQVAALHARHLGSTPEQILRELRGETPMRLHPTLSYALVIDGRVMGFTLAELERLNPTEARVHSTVVDPSLQGGWANLWLKYHGGCRCKELGVTTLLHRTYEKHTDTRTLARQWGVTTRQMVEPFRMLAAPPRDG